MAIYEWNEAIQTLERQPDSSYRSKWACFPCRKSFVRTRESREDEVACPDCGAATVDMGYLFEPPARRDRRGWKRMHVLAEHGFGFHKVSAKFYIDRFFTDGDKLSPKMVEARLRRFLDRQNQRRRARPG